MPGPWPSPPRPYLLLLPSREKSVSKIRTDRSSVYKGRLPPAGKLSFSACPRGRAVQEANGEETQAPTCMTRQHRKGLRCWLPPPALSCECDFWGDSPSPHPNGGTASIPKIPAVVSRQEGWGAPSSPPPWLVSSSEESPSAFPTSPLFKVSRYGGESSSGDLRASEPSLAQST